MEENFDLPKSITFDYEARANLPQHIKDKMKADREKAKSEKWKNEIEAKRKLALKKANDEYYDRNSQHYKDNQRFSWAVKTINKGFDEDLKKGSIDQPPQ